MWDSYKANSFPWFENEKGTIRRATFIHSDYGHEKEDKTSRKLSKNKECIDGAWPKNKW